MNEIERKQKIYQELLEEARKSQPERLPGEFTIVEFAEDGKFSKDKARKFLFKMVDDGKITMRRTNRNIYFSVV